MIQYDAFEKMIRFHRANPLKSEIMIGSVLIALKRSDTWTYSCLLNEHTLILGNVQDATMYSIDKSQQ